MNITLADFQRKAIHELMEGMCSEQRDIILKSCTGSGKTIILTHFMDEYQKLHPEVVFVWLTPGKGSLEEQSREKMERYIRGASTKRLSDVMAQGFKPGDMCFINWEKLTKKGNNALKDSERTNFLQHIEQAHDSYLGFVIVVDESHQNDTVKADDIIGFFGAQKIIHCSATPKLLPGAFVVNIPEEAVISEGLIKKMLIINEDFPPSINVDDQVSYLLEQALKKRRQLHMAYLKRKVSVNPLIIVQIPNKSELLLDQVERYYESQNITYENNLLAVWLADKKQNLEDIDKNASEPIVVIIKQAVATGWDCPRAQILVKLRDNMSETFEIQTIGRIRRMPEAKHYQDDLLDSCYLYTLDEKFSEGVRKGLGKGALEAVKLFLKAEHRDFSLICEKTTSVPFPGDALFMLNRIGEYYEAHYSLPSESADKTCLESAGYSFSMDIVDTTKSGSVSVLNQHMFNDLNQITIYEKLDTHKHGREYHHSVSEIGLKLGLSYNTMNAMIQRLFCNKLLKLEIRSLYAFVINNKRLLMQDFAAAMAGDGLSRKFPANTVIEELFYIPQEAAVTYDAYAKTQTVMHKNVYRGYLSSAEPRSPSEKAFEQYCERSEHVLWFYKNGAVGEGYFSIVCEDHLGRQKLLYPDYIVGAADGHIWIVETKDGFSKSGGSEDNDKYSGKKLAFLKAYLDKHGLSGGIVRQNKEDMELYICMEHYRDDISGKEWELVSRYF